MTREPCIGWRSVLATLRGSVIEGRHSSAHRHRRRGRVTHDRPGRPHAGREAGSAIRSQALPTRPCCPNWSSGARCRRPGGSADVSAPVQPRRQPVSNTRYVLPRHELHQWNMLQTTPSDLLLFRRVLRHRLRVGGVLQFRRQPRHLALRVDRHRRPRAFRRRSPTGPRVLDNQLPAHSSLDVWPCSPLDIGVGAPGLDDSLDLLQSWERLLAPSGRHSSILLGD